MSGATGDFAAGAAVTPPPRGRTSGSTDAQSAAPSQGLRAYYNRVSPNSYMSTAWSSPGARAVEPSPEQHASRRQPIDMSSIPSMLLTCTSTQLPNRIKALHPGDTRKKHFETKPTQNASFGKLDAEMLHLGNSHLFHSLICGPFCSGSSTS